MLYIVATPIGNLGDFSARGIETLRSVDVIACEDTRRTRTLLTHFSIPAPQLVSYREQTEARAGARILGFLQEGSSVALCTDGGYPGISDPGYRLVALAAENDIPVQVVPGAGAVEASLLLSGLPSSSYTFKGFPPRKRGAMCRFFEQERDLPHTLVVFESPFRVGKALAVAFETLGDRRASVCIELTKKFERVSRGFLGELADEYADRKVKGEVAIVIAGNNPKFTRSE
jgi:16S rRNA (cytidine1402-2'-O)-methyltransferase